VTTKAHFSAEQIRAPARIGFHNDGSRRFN
jgi:hypothetical protein